MLKTTPKSLILQICFNSRVKEFAQSHPATNEILRPKFTVVNLSMSSRMFVFIPVQGTLQEFLMIKITQKLKILSHKFLKIPKVS